MELYASFEGPFWTILKGTLSQFWENYGPVLGKRWAGLRTFGQFWETFPAVLGELSASFLGPFGQFSGTNVLGEL